MKKHFNIGFFFQKNKSKYLFITSYALEVSGFPSFVYIFLSFNFLIKHDSTVRDENKIRMHFEKFGPVQECKLARNFFGTLKMKMEGAKNDFKFRMEEKRCERNPMRSEKRKTFYFRKMLKEDMNVTKRLMSHSKENLTKVTFFSFTGKCYLHF